jgi:hypothetical protein
MKHKHNEKSLFGSSLKNYFSSNNSLQNIGSASMPISKSMFPSLLNANVPFNETYSVDEDSWEMQEKISVPLSDNSREDVNVPNDNEIAIEIAGLETGDKLISISSPLLMLPSESANTNIARDDNVLDIPIDNKSLDLDIQVDSNSLDIPMDSNGLGMPVNISVVAANLPLQNTNVNTRAPIINVHRDRRQFNKGALCRQSHDTTKKLRVSVFVSMKD